MSGPLRSCGRSFQWLSIHGRVPGNVFAAPVACRLLVLQPQDGPCTCVELRAGACAARSFVAKAARRPVSMLPSRGAVTMTLGAGVPQDGQSFGSRYSAIGRSAVKTPQLAQA